MVHTEITYGDEFIKELIPQPVEIHEKPKMYHSKYGPNVRTELKKNKHQAKTMGPAKVKVPTPQNYLHKNQAGDVPKAIMADSKTCIKQKRKPAVPRHDEQNQVAAKTEKDFIRTNAIENITSVPRKPNAKYCDTVHGHTNDLINSGMVPRYSCKPEFGKIPPYLVKKNAAEKAAQAQYDEYVANIVRQGALEQVGDYDREEILTGLKQKWEELHHQYQGLSVVTDTAPKKNRKERMEAQMSQLERDIAMLERHSTLYVTNN